MEYEITIKRKVRNTDYKPCRDLDNIYTREYNKTENNEFNKIEVLYFECSKKQFEFIRGASLEAF